MKLEELLELEPTMSEYTSEKLLLEAMLTQGWRTYGPGICEESEDLARRFLSFHARIPGFFSKEIYGRLPAGVFYLEKNNQSIKGGLFKNGAVFVTIKESGERGVTLLIDDATAERMGYPEEGYEHLTQE